MSWDALIADLQRRRDEIDKAIDAVQTCRALCEGASQQVCEVDVSRSATMRQMLRMAIVGNPYRRP
jgi:hypothetical protein